MGYTHYWTFSPDIDEDVWDAAIDECCKILNAARDQLDLSIEHDHGYVFVNHRDHRAHETFEIAGDPRFRAQAVAHGFHDFCKTNRNPYDIVVTACLCRLAEAGLIVTSDGDVSDWQPGAQLAGRVLGRTVQVPLRVRRASGAAA